MKKSTTTIIIILIAIVAIISTVYFQLNREYSYVEDFLCSTFTTKEYTHITTDNEVCFKGKSGSEDYGTYQCIDPYPCG